MIGAITDSLVEIQIKQAHSLKANMPVLKTALTFDMVLHN